MSVALVIGFDSRPDLSQIRLKGIQGVPDLIRFVFASLLIVPIAFGQTTITTAQIAQRVSPAVVVIQGKTDSGEVQGSGFIISKDGKVVTNLHVIRDMKTASVQLANRRVFDSLSVLAVDEGWDLAIIKVAGFNLTTLAMGNSDTLTVGERVVVVGSPLGLDATVTAGILSAIRDSGKGFKLLQTDAAVNHGNSGGPLVAGNGLAVGVVSSILRSDSAQGLNFAIPINYVRTLLANLHGPISLEQMRHHLAVAGTPENSTADLPLKEALHWIKGRVASETFNFSASVNGEAWSVRENFSLESESCSPIFNTLMTFKTNATQDSPNEVNVLRVTVPLTEVVYGSVDKGDLFPDITNGDRRGYIVTLRSKTNVMVKSEPPNQPNTDHAFLTFRDESVAKRALAVVLHAADLCREAETARVGTTTSDPSLKDTLDWLKETIPLTTRQFSASMSGRSVVYIVKDKVWSLDSCRVTLGEEVTITDRDSVGVDVKRGNIPLGALIQVNVERHPNIWEFRKDVYFVSGEKFAYAVSLKTKSTDIVHETISTYPKLQLNNVVVTSRVDSFDIGFSDESLAQRVAKAFLHAANLCRKDEPF